MVLESQYSEWEDIVKKAYLDLPSFDQVSQVISPILKAVGLPENPSDLVGRKVMLLYPAAEVEDLETSGGSIIKRNTKREIDEYLEFLARGGWILQIEEVKGILYFGGSKMKGVSDEFMVKAGNISFHLNEETPGEWNQDAWPTLGKYKFL